MLTAAGMLPTEQPARLRPGGRQRRTTRQRGAGVLGVGRVHVVPRGGGEQLAWPRSCQATATTPTSTQHPRPFSGVAPLSWTRWLGGGCCWWVLLLVADGAGVVEGRVAALAGVEKLDGSEDRRGRP